MNEDIKLCIVCGGPLKEDLNDDQICDDCEDVRAEVTNGKGDDEDE